MRIARIHSHLGGGEWLVVRRPEVWVEIGRIVNRAGSGAHGTGGRGGVGDGSPARIASGQLLAREFLRGEWSGTSRRRYFLKARVAVEVHLGCHGQGGHSLFAGHLANFVSDTIDIGIDLLPIRPVGRRAPADFATYRGALSEAGRWSRGFPAVPLLLVGLEP